MSVNFAPNRGRWVCNEARSGLRSEPGLVAVWILRRRGARATGARGTRARGGEVTAGALRRCGATWRARGALRSATRGGPRAAAGVLGRAGPRQSTCGSGGEPQRPLGQGRPRAGAGAAPVGWPELGVGRPAGGGSYCGGFGAVAGASPWPVDGRAGLGGAAGAAMPRARGVSGLGGRGSPVDGGGRGGNNA
jgi:hypothetical protein